MTECLDLNEEARNAVTLGCDYEDAKDPSNTIIIV